MKTGGTCTFFTLLFCVKQHKCAVSFHLGKKLCWECQQPSLCQAPNWLCLGALKWFHKVSRRYYLAYSPRVPDVFPKPEDIQPPVRAHGVPGAARVRLRWEIPAGSTAWCSRPFSLLSACEDGYKLENETCVRYGDCSALLPPHHPCSGDLLAQLSCWNSLLFSVPSCPFGLGGFNCGNREYQISFLSFSTVSEVGDLKQIVASDCV